MWRFSFPEFSLASKEMLLLYGGNKDVAARPVNNGQQGYDHKDIESGFITHYHRFTPRRSRHLSGKQRRTRLERNPRTGTSNAGVCRRDVVLEGWTAGSHLPPSASTSASTMSSPAIATTEHPTSDFDSSHLSELLPSFMSSATTIITRDGTTATAHCPRLPSKTLPPLIRRLRHKWLTVYRRLSILCLLPNVLCMVVLGILGRPRLLQLPLSALAIAVTANFLAAILIRQELVINLLFILFGHCPQWMPLRIRRLSAKIYHLGGVHSGAAVAGTVWFGILSFAIFKSQNLHASLRAAILSITGVLDMLMVAIVATAEPHFRRRFHDQFEWCQ